MGKVESQELKELLVQKQILCRKESKREITEEEFKEQMEPIDKRCSEITQQYIREDWLKRHPENTNKSYINDEEITNSKNVLMEETKMSNEAKEVKPTVDKVPSNAQLILKALQMKTVKTYDDVASKVKENKPTVIDRRIKAMAKTMVKEIEKGIGKKSKLYKWDAANFLLTPVE